MADEVRQDEQIEKLWDAIQEIREEHHDAITETHKTIGTVASELREMRTVAIGIDGKNGLRSEIHANADAIKELKIKVETGFRTCPWGEKVMAHLNEHAEKGKNTLTATRFYIGQALMVLLFVAGLWLKK